MRRGLHDADDHLIAAWSPTGRCGWWVIDFIAESIEAGGSAARFDLDAIVGETYRW